MTADVGLGSILVVCGANQCRSPLANAILRDRLQTRGVDVEVRSCGTRASEGAPATHQTRRAAARLGLDIDGHRSTPLTADLATHAGLVVAMERAQVREVVALAPASWSRAFTLKELIRRARMVGPRRADETGRQWIARVHQGRRPADLLGASTADDVADPTNDLSTDHPRLAEELDVLVGALVDLLYPTSPV
jgi:protein-tyrosine-phosphatase